MVGGGTPIINKEQKNLVPLRNMPGSINILNSTIDDRITTNKITRYYIILLSTVLNYIQVVATNFFRIMQFRTPTLCTTIIIRHGRDMVGLVFLNKKFKLQIFHF